MFRINFSGTQKLTFSEDCFIKTAFAIFAVLNLVSFLTYWFDKRRAGTGKDRISESRLLQLSFLGPVGSVPGIWWVRHKTKKVSYLVKYFAVLTLSIAAHIAIGYFWFRGGQ